MSVELAVKPRGPYSLSSSARFASDATRTFRDGLFTQVLDVDGRIELARAWQAPDGTVAIVADRPRAPNVCAGSSRSTTTTPISSGSSATTRCSAPRRGHCAGFGRYGCSTVAQSLLRAFCGQLIEAKVARRLEQKIIRKLCAAGPERLHAAPTTTELGAVAPMQLRALGLHTRRAAALVRICRSLELERLHTQPTDAIVRRLERERGLGPWSIGVVCLEGLGRVDHGLVGDLGLVKLLRALRGRPVEGWETAELLEPYGAWAGLASVYMLAGFGRGLLPISEARAA